MTQIVSLGDMVKISKLSTNPSKTPNETYHVFSIPGFDIGSPEKLTGNKILSNKFTLDKPSILVSKLNPRIHRVWKIARPPKFAICSTEFVVLQPKNIDDFDYLYALTSSADFQRYLLQLVKGTSTSHQRVKPEDLLDFPLPDTDNSTYIGKFVSDIDEKIDLNRKMNDTLEQIGQALFHQYFIANPEANNWTNGKVGDVLSALESGTRPKGGAVGSGVPSVGAENIEGPGKYDYSKEKFVSEIFYNKANRGKIKSEDVLLYKDGAYVGKKSLFMDGFPHKKCMVNEHVFILRTNESLKSQFFLYYWLNQHHITEKIISNGVKAAQPGLNQSGVNGLPVLIPPAEDIAIFDNAVRPIMGRLFASSIENRNLTALRDIVLPRLISGKIKL